MKHYWLGHYIFVPIVYVDGLDISRDNDNMPANNAYDEEDYEDDTDYVKSRNKKRYNSKAKFYFFHDPRRYSTAYSQSYYDQMPEKSACNVIQCLMSNV